MCTLCQFRGCLCFIWGVAVILRGERRARDKKDGCAARVSVFRCLREIWFLSKNVFRCWYSSWDMVLFCSLFDMCTSVGTTRGQIYRSCCCSCFWKIFKIKTDSGSILTQNENLPDSSRSRMTKPLVYSPCSGWLVGWFLFSILLVQYKSS